jgi:UDP-N-acetylglucosamine--N-acetylmuramyl-(pentapeptide) pyrophosphoryl-undecaprenol N-acetylglucosamine transferase
VIRAVGHDTILLAGGGTGGHLFPGVAVAEAVARRAPGSRGLLAITARDAVSAHGAACPLEQVRVDSPRRPAGASGVPVFGARMARAVTKSLRLLREERVSVVVGLGGYGSVAPVVAARMAGIPALLLEQNAVPGQATRVLSRLAAVTAASFPGIAARGVRGRVVLTGNPLRAGVLHTRADHVELGLAPGVATLAVLGGSLGARGMNERFAAALPALAKSMWPTGAELAAGEPPGNPRFQVIHATGSERGTAEMLRVYRRLGIRACVRPFFSDMASVYGTADAALCRAGGTTVAELAAVGLPAVLVPYPHHADGHQRENARELVDAGAAAVLEEADMSPTKVIAAVRPVLRDADVRRERARAARSVGRPGAATHVARLVLELSRGERPATSAEPVAAAAARTDEQEGSPA